MRGRTKLKALGLVALLALFGMMLTGQSQATSGGTSTIWFLDGRIYTPRERI